MLTLCLTPSGRDLVEVLKGRRGPVQVSVFNARPISGRHRRLLEFSIFLHPLRSTLAILKIWSVAAVTLAQLEADSVVVGTSLVGSLQERFSLGRSPRHRGSGHVVASCWIPCARIRGSLCTPLGHGGDWNGGGGLPPLLLSHLRLA